MSNLISFFMRKILLFLFLIVPVWAFAQKDSLQLKLSSDSVRHIINDLHYPKYISFDGNDIEFYKSPEDLTSVGTLDKYEDSYIIGDNETKYLCTSYGKAFWVNKKDVPLSQDSINNILHNRCHAYSQYVKLCGKRNSSVDELDFYHHVIAVYKRCPIVFRTELYDGDDDLKTTSLDFSIDNNLKKTIKYVYITVRGYNAVNDPVGRSQTKTCIGPIKHGETANYEFKDIWWTDIIESVKIIGLKLKFMDNTYRIIPHPERCRFPWDLKYDEDYIKKLDPCIDVSVNP